MEKFNELRNKWIDAIKPINGLSTKALYFLLEPDDDNKFFDTVDSVNDCVVGMCFLDFRMLAIEYLLEYKKQNKLKTESNTPNTVTIPLVPMDNEELQRLTRPITAAFVVPNIGDTWSFKTIDPIVPYYSTTSNISYKSDNNCSTNSTNTKQNKSDCRDIEDNSSDDCDKCNNN